MKRPMWRSARLTAVLVGLSILAGCGAPQSGIKATEETARYLQNARGRYAIPGPRTDPWGPYIREASRRFDVPDQWIRALMRQESGGNLFREGRLITSSAGAMGLMQVMPGTYDELRPRYGLGPDPFDPHDNIMAGVAYMREMYDIYGSPGFLAAYNAGPNRLDDYLANQRSLPAETRNYVASIGPALRTASPRNRSPAEQYAINQLPLNIPPGPRYGYGSAPTAVAVAQTYQAQPTRRTGFAYATPPAARQASVLAATDSWTARTSASRNGSRTAVVIEDRRPASSIRLISSASAAEVTQRYRKAVRVSHVDTTANRTHGSSHQVVASRRVHAAVSCRGGHSGRSLCGPVRQTRK